MELQFALYIPSPMSLGIQVHNTGVRVFPINGKEDRTLAATKWETTVGRVKREYPTEWAMYPADGEGEDRQEQRNEEQHNVVNVATGDPNRFGESSSDRRGAS